MSGTASRFQGRFPYMPGLMVGQYPLPAPAQPAPPVPTGVSTVRAAPVMGVTPPAAASTVQAGSIDPTRLREVGDGAGGSAQAGYGGPGPSGTASTGSVLGDIAGFANVAGPALGSLAAGPMGIASLGIGAIASGLAAALGAPETAAGIARSVGLPGVAPVGYDPAFVSVRNADPAGASGIPSEVAAAHDLGHEMGVGGDSGGKGADAGTGANSENTSSGGGDKGEWMRGGYTGPGHPAEPAGTVHKGEVVIPAEQVQRYGLDPLLMLARGQVAPSRLSALLSL